MLLVLFKRFLFLHVAANAFWFAANHYPHTPSHKAAECSPAQLITISPGSSISQALRKAHQNPALVAEVAKLNRLANPNIVQPGVLRLPSSCASKTKAVAVALAHAKPSTLSSLSVEKPNAQTSFAFALVPTALFWYFNQRRKLKDAELALTQARREETEAKAATQSASLAKHHAQAAANEAQTRAQRLATINEVQERLITDLKKARAATPPPRGGRSEKITRDSALELFGFSEATNGEIKARHKQLLKIFHPDACANNNPRMAARLNAAFDYLVKSR